MVLGVPILKHFRVIFWFVYKTVNNLLICNKVVLCCMCNKGEVNMYVYNVASQALHLVILLHHVHFSIPVTQYLTNPGSAK